MYLLTESIRVYNGKVFNIQRHNERCNKARKELLNLYAPLDLRKYMHIPDAFSKGLVKCRILYDKNVRDVDFTHYSIRKIRKLCTVQNDNISYSHKFADRPELDKLYHLKGHADEIIIIKNGLITDAYYYNIVMERNGRLFTPALPLLQGTRRASLLEKGKIEPIDIPIDLIYDYDALYLVNALTPLGDIKVQINRQNIFS